MIDYFLELGSRIEDAWRGCDYEGEKFPDLVIDELQRRPPKDHVSLTDIYDWMFKNHQGFRQPSKTSLFGEPPILLYDSSRFYIEALFWRTSTTDIHNHAFCGGFYVLAGSSVHSHWKFETHRRINSRMRTGQLTLDSTEILGVGDMKPIRSGDELIHQLFHLEVPSVTLVVRTYQDSDRLPQAEYRPPGLGLSSMIPDTLLQRRLLFLDGIAKGELEGLETYGLRLMTEADLETVYFSLETLVQNRRFFSEQVLATLLQAAREQHGEIVELLWSVCVEQRRIRVVRSRRRLIHEPSARFLVALLMLMPDRDSIFRAIRLRQPDVDELNSIEQWLVPCSGLETIGFELDDCKKAIFRGLVRGEEMEQILARLTSIDSGKTTGTERARTENTIRKMAASELFRGLFSESPLQPRRIFPGD